ncbi:CECR2 protein, partial [Polyodon spathula]|nr:CECR2 protein [Polyodon spathula]
YLDDEEYTSMFKVLETVKTHKDSWPFCDPVDEHYAPGYYNQIQTPMDLTTIEDKLITNRYKTTEDFVADFSLIIKNCDQYNGKENEYSLMARTLEQCFNKAMRKYFPEEKSESDEEEFTLEGKKEKRKRFSSHCGKTAAELFMTPLNNFHYSSGCSQLLMKQEPGTMCQAAVLTSYQYIHRTVPPASTATYPGQVYTPQLMAALPSPVFVPLVNIKAPPLKSNRPADIQTIQFCSNNYPKGQSEIPAFPQQYRPSPEPFIQQAWPVAHFIPAFPHRVSVQGSTQAGLVEGKSEQQQTVVFEVIPNPHKVPVQQRIVSPCPSHLVSCQTTLELTSQGNLFPLFFVFMWGNISNYLYI